MHARSQRTFVVAIALLGVAALLRGAPLAASPADSTLAEIASRYIAARGGMEAIRSVRSIIYHGPERPDGRPGRWMAKARPYYFVVGDPRTERSFAEGFDGASWEYYRDPGLVLRTSDAPSAASRHTAYFDDPLVYFGEPGWAFELRGTETIGDQPAYWIRATYPDGHERDVFVDRETWLVIANRVVAPIHAFGEAVATETRISDYRDVNGALFPMRFDEYVIATGLPVDGALGPGWVRVEVNVPLPLDFFSPPPEPADPLARLANAIFATRSIPGDALGWYRDFRATPPTRGIDTERAMEAVGYQCLKNGAVETGVLLLEANLADYPGSADAHFGAGRAYRAAGREAEAVERFREALRLDPDHQRAAAALEAEGNR
jgi:tetratricopeptide repeat protein